MEKIKDVMLHHRRVLLVVRTQLLFIRLLHYERKRDVTYIPREVLDFYCVSKDSVIMFVCVALVINTEHPPLKVVA
jgi:hypothetical protein